MTLKQAIDRKQLDGPFGDSLLIVRQKEHTEKYVHYMIASEDGLRFAQFGMSSKATAQEVIDFLSKKEHILSWYTQSAHANRDDWRAVTATELVKWTKQTMETDNETR